VFVPGKPCLIFAGKAGAFTQVKTPGLTYKCQNRPEKLAWDKLSYLLRMFLKYRCKKFYNIDTRSRSAANVGRCYDRADESLT